MTVPPVLCCGAPIKSSILLASLIPVDGRDGGARPVAKALTPGVAVEDEEPGREEESAAPGLEVGSLSVDGGSFDGRPVGADADAEVVCCNGGLAKCRLGLAFLDVALEGGPLEGGPMTPRPTPPGGPAAALTVLLGGPFGGGGVAVGTGVLSAPPFLLTQRLRFVS